MPGHPRQFEAATGAFRRLRDAWERLNGLYREADRARLITRDHRFKKTQKAWTEALAEFSDALAELQRAHDERVRTIERYIDPGGQDPAAPDFIYRPPRKRAAARKAS